MTTNTQGLPLSLKSAVFERQDKIRDGINRMIAEHRRGNFFDDGSINISRLIANIGIQVYEREVTPVLAEIRAETAKARECSPS
ncbi:hypothetical protein A3K87_20665 [Variovorax paradoxus]|uniref:Uncharacterized protein n=1 Tax=Variovorax paradoxus TaxID=34073 RepID=A0AA91DM11_VARPD|nr:hypothetical protein [Variovorax paradoxus]OAK61702.1 hypothetical protein A3K87_20665 [Variovorax paradoxus]